MKKLAPVDENWGEVLVEQSEVPDYLTQPSSSHIPGACQGQLIQSSILVYTSSPAPIREGAVSSTAPTQGAYMRTAPQTVGVSEELTSLVVEGLSPLNTDVVTKDPNAFENDITFDGSPRESLERESLEKD